MLRARLGKTRLMTLRYDTLQSMEAFENAGTKTLLGWGTSRLIITCKERTIGVQYRSQRSGRLRTSVKLSATICIPVSPSFSVQ